MIIINALIIAYTFMIIIGAVLASAVLLGIVMVVVGLVRFYKPESQKWQKYKDLKKGVLKSYDQNENKNHNKKVAKHTRVK
jgi:hypothetical protein